MFNFYKFTKKKEFVSPIHFINVVKESMNTVRLANSLYVVLAQCIATLLSAKSALYMGVFRRELTIASLFVVIEATCSWVKEILTEARSLGKYTKKVELALLYGSLLFIASEIFLFSSLISTSFDRYANQTLFDRLLSMDYLTQTSPVSLGEVWIATILLVGSSAALNAYKAHYDSFDESVGRLLNGRAVQLLGLGFVSLQLAEYVGNWAVIYLTCGAGSFFLVTGFHGLHVIIGLILLIQQIELAHLELKNIVNVGLFYSVLYWHFVDAVWIVVVVLIYILQLSAEPFTFQ